MPRVTQFASLALIYRIKSELEELIRCFFFSSGGQPPNGQTVGDLVTPPPTSNGPPPGYGTPPGANHPIPTLGAHRLPMMPPPPGMQFRPPFGHPHGPGAPPFFPHGPPGAMHGER
jgi:hypothetical protein